MQNKIYEDAKNILKILINESIADKETIISVIPSNFLAIDKSTKYKVEHSETIDYLLSEGVFELIERYEPRSYPANAGSFKLLFNFKKGRDLYKKLNGLSCGDLYLDLETSSLEYKGEKVDVDLTDNRIILIKLLLENKGKFLDYQTLSPFFGKKWIPNANNADTKTYLQNKKGQLVKFLQKELGIDAKELESMIGGKGGYMLYCTD